MSVIMLGFLPKGCVRVPDTMHPSGTHIKFMLPGRNSNGHNITVIIIKILLVRYVANLQYSWFYEHIKYNLEYMHNNNIDYRL